MWGMRPPLKGMCNVGAKEDLRAQYDRCLGTLIRQSASSSTTLDDSDEDSHSLAGFCRDKESLEQFAAVNLHLSMAEELGVDR